MCFCDFGNLILALITHYLLLYLYSILDTIYLIIFSLDTNFKLKGLIFYDKIYQDIIFTNKIILE